MLGNILWLHKPLNKHSKRVINTLEFSVENPDTGFLMVSMTTSCKISSQHLVLRGFTVTKDQSTISYIFPWFYKINLLLFQSIPRTPETISVPTQATTALLCAQWDAVCWLRRYLLPKQQFLFYSTYSYNTPLLSQMKNTCFLSVELTLDSFATKGINCFQLQHELTTSNSIVSRKTLADLSTFTV